MPMSSPPATSLFALAERNATLHPDRLALAGPTQRLTWTELIACARRIGAAIEHHGLAHGDRVCFCLPSAPLWVAAFLATRHLGLTAVSIGDRARPAELQALVARFNVRLVLADETRPALDGTEILDVASIPEAASTVERRHHDAALIHLTSGSSGVPRGVLRTEPDLIEEARNVAAALGLTPGDAVLCATPVHHSFASGLLTACLDAGAPCLLMDRLAPAALLDLTAREHATIIAGVPYVFQTLTALSSTQTLPALRLAISGGAPLHDGLASSFRQRFDAPLVQEYGLSEAGIVALNLDGPPSSVGPPIPNVEVHIVDPEDPSRDLPSGAVGEVIVRRVCPPAGYLGHPEETAETFTPYGIRTGDLGRLDAAGRLKLTGRIKSMINVAGAKVAPREVEDALLAHPGVAEAVAFSLPDESRGEAVAAAVIPHQDTTLTEQALREHCRTLLSAYKVPAFICIEPGLPRTASGKPDLPRIRESALRRLP